MYLSAHCSLFQDEGVKEFDSFVDVKNSSVSPLSGKKKSVGLGYPPLPFLFVTYPYPSLSLSLPPLLSFLPSLLFPPVP